MFDFSIYGDDTLKSVAALYNCTICPPPGEPCPDWAIIDPSQPA